MMKYTLITSPWCPLLVSASEGRVQAVRLLREGERPRPDWARDDRAFDAVRAAFEAYFEGRSAAFEFEREPARTPFLGRVYDQVSRVPPGATTTYGEVATAVGSPGAARAVGQAMHRNPFAIVMPCHRVLGRGGGLHGYAYGLETKRAILDFERARFGVESGTLFGGGR